ncbi:MAG: phenylacetate--CoA ligase, partial [Deltaproteobacteria bacterium]|nr:phenylacetate--CoA ligase [Deltaproteobacteria bacterium]
MYWEKEIETMDREPLERMQAARLRETLQRAKKSVHYGKRFVEMGLDVDGIRTVADVEKLPLTNKEDLRESWPYGFLACSRDDLIRMHSSSGTTGRATVIFHTANDIAAWTNLLARSMYMAGMRRSDVFQNMMTYGLFTGG